MAAGSGRSDPVQPHLAQELIDEVNARARRNPVLPHLAHELQRKFHIMQFPHAPIEELKVIVSGAALSYFISRKSSSSCFIACSAPERQPLH